MNPKGEGGSSVPQGKGLCKGMKGSQKLGVYRIERMGLGDGLGLSPNHEPSRDNPGASGLYLRHCLGRKGCFGARKRHLRHLQAQDLDCLSTELNSLNPSFLLLSRLSLGSWPLSLCLQTKLLQPGLNQEGILLQNPQDDRDLLCHVTAQVSGSPSTAQHR